MSSAEFIDMVGPQEGEIDLFTQSNPTPSILPEAASERAKKQDFALGTRSPGVDVLKHEITTVGEHVRRNVLASEQSMERNRQREEAVRSYIQSRPKGAPLDPREVDVLFSREATPTSVSDNDVSMEREYAKQVMLTAMNEVDMDRETIQGALRRNGVEVARAIGSGEKLITAKEGFQKLAEEYEAKWKERSWGDSIVPIAATFVPFYSWWSTTNAAKDVKADAWFPGSNRRQQVEGLLREALQDPENGVRLAREAIERINQVSPKDAVDFAQKLVSYTTSSQTLDNVFGALEVALAPGVPSVVSGISGAARGAVAAAGRRSMSTIGLIDATGNVQRASLAEVTERLRGLSNNTHIPQRFEDIERSAVSMFNPGDLLTGSQFLSRERVQRLETYLTGQSADLLTALAGAKQDARIVGQVQQSALARAEDLARREYPYANDAVLNVRPVVAEDTLAGVDHIAVQFGTREATLFNSREAAIKAADETYKFTDYKVSQQGAGWYIEVTKNVNETDHLVRDALAIQTNHTTPRSLFNSFTSLLRSPDHLVSEATRRDLSATTFGASSLQGVLQTAVENSLGTLKRFRRESFDNLNTFAARQRDYVDPVTRRRGMFSTNQGEFEQHWHSQFGRAPSFEESTAYWSYVQLSDFDLVTRNLAVLRDKQRLGLENFEFPWRPNIEVSAKPSPSTASPKSMRVANDDPTPIGGSNDNMPAPSVPFDARSNVSRRTMEVANENVSLAKAEGRFTDVAPWHIDTNARIAIWDETGNHTIVQTKYAPAAERGTVDTLMQNGWKLIHLSDTGTRNLQTAGALSQRVEYVLTPSAKVSPLDLQQIPRRPGGHVEYQQGYFIRQPEITRSAGRFDRTTYYGDRSFFHFTTEADANLNVGRINQARLMWNDEPALAGYLQRELPHVFPSVGEFKRQFHAAGLDPDVPLFVSPKGVSLDKTGALETLRRSPEDVIERFGESQHNLYRDGINFQYLGERSDQMNTILNGHPQAANLVDPVSTLLRANNQLMRAKYMGDLKIKSAERFIAEFGHVLDAKSLDEVRAHPLQWLLEPKWKEGADRVEMATAKAFRRSVVSIMGEKSEVQKAAEYVKAGIAERMFTVGGERGYTIATNAMELPLIKDPVRFARSVAFHAKLGLFNLEQLPLQAQTFFHIAAVSGPLRASAAMGAGLLQRMMALTNRPDVVNYIARAAGGVGWRNPDHFLESARLMQETGFARVGREFANIGDFVEETVIASKVGRVLTAGTIPFREAETLVRYTAWNSAYAEWRAINPTRAIRDQDRIAILQRANDLSNNMTAASDAAIQKNIVASIPLQFLSYQARMTENILSGLLHNGGPLNRAEAVRALAMHSALYGVPVGVGMGIGVWPVAESWRKYLLDKPGVAQSWGAESDNLAVKVLNDGIMAYMSELATGTKFSVGERYGAGGVSLFKDLLTGTDEEKIKAITGASGSVMSDLYKAAFPMWSAFTKTTEDGGYPLKVQDLIDTTSSVKSVNSTLKLWYALNHQKYLSKNQSALVDVTAKEAWVSYLSGVLPQDISDLYKIMENDKQKKALQKISENEAIKNYKLAARSFDKGNVEEGVDFQKRAAAHLEGGGFNPQEKARILARSFKDQEDLFARVITKYGRANQDKFDAATTILKRRQVILTLERGDPTGGQE